MSALRSSDSLRRFPLRLRHAVAAGILLGALPWSAVPTTAHADILRQNVQRQNAARNAQARQQAGAEAAAAAHQVSQDRLRQTTQALQAMKSAQAAARAAASAAAGVTDGLSANGLQVDTATPRWDGATAPTESVGGGKVLVNIRQTKEQAVLHWSKFNVGRNTNLNFDQSQGGADSGKWVAFNKVNDPSGDPSRILGSITAQGQVYVVNRNGVIFGAGSQVNARGLVASALPINDNLIQRGLLNHNKNAAEFLFSGAASQASVIVEQGALLTATTTPDGSGGRVVLAGPNVINAGTISTPGGQTILAAGLQIGFDAHSKEYPVIPGRKPPVSGAEDPSLRGMDVYIGDVGAAGTVTNRGLIEIPTGSLIMAGRTVEQNGVVDSLTTVTLNGRVDLLANYNAVPNTSYDPDIAGQLAFLNQTTGTVRLGSGSVTRILPDWQSTATTVGTKLPLKSQVNIQGNRIEMESGAMLQAPNGDVSLAAGNWRPLAQQLSDKFTFTSGSIRVGSGAFIDLAGSTEVFVPLEGRILQVELRGSELSLSPLQRGGPIRGVPLTIDSRRTGTYQGKYWMGTPLGDAVGFLDIVPKDAAQLTAQGGSLLLRAGDSIQTAPGSVMDVSGGYFRHEGGRVQTTRLLRGNRIVDIADATPDVVYDGIFTAKWTRSSSKWGVSETFASPLAPLGARTEADYVEGAAGGELSLVAPALALGGELRGATVEGPLQIRGKITGTSSPSTSTLPEAGRLRLRFEGEREVFVGEPKFFAVSPLAPRVVLGADGGGADFTLGADFYKKTGFGNLEIVNKEGAFEVAAGSRITLPARGSLTVAAKNILLAGDIRAPGGTLDFTAHALPPYETAIQQAVNPLMSQPAVKDGAGRIVIAPGKRMDVSGTVTDDRVGADAAVPIAINGGAINLTGYDVILGAGSVLDVSGGLAVNPFGRATLGNAGSITIAAGQDPVYPSVLGGKLELGSELRGYGGNNGSRIGKGGTLSIKAPRIQIGGGVPARGVLHLTESFFNRGGFQKFVLTGIGAPAEGPQPVDPDAPKPFEPAVLLADGTKIDPQIEGWIYRPNSATPLQPFLRPLSERPSATVELRSATVKNSFRDAATGANQGEVVVVRGDIVTGADSMISVAPGGGITLRGSTVTVRGTLNAPGGSILIQGDRTFPLDKLDEDNATFALPTVYIAPTARISAPGAVVPLPDSYGRMNAAFYPGGTIDVKGNIVAEKGAILDVSGVSGVRDAHPLELGLSAGVPGVIGTPYWLRTTPVRIDTDGGTITLAGHEMLVSDATLLGRAGGPTARGGTLAISSGKFTPKGAARFGSEINLAVTQSGTVLEGNHPRGIGRPVRDASGAVLPSMGYFAVDTFANGGFDSLDLGFNTEPGSGLAKGGNIEFRGPVAIEARGFVRLASGGILRADAPVSVKAAYIAVGQPFPTPLTPAEAAAWNFFDKDDGLPGNREAVAPSSGPGSFSFQAPLIDTGTLVFKNTSSVRYHAPDGDIRGSGYLNVMGDLSLSAAQIYPVSMADFFIAAYDTPGGNPGSVRITQSGRAAAPLSAGGRMSIYGSVIEQAGTLHAPFGSVALGWDGTDRDPSTPAVDAPSNPVVGSLLTIAKSKQISLRPGSVTSVAGIDPRSSLPLLVPFGISPDGLTVVDARGLDVTSTGLPEKRITIGADNVILDSGATIDLRGGGDLFASRWVNGTGGSINFLGTPGASWNSGFKYNAGDMVYYGGKMYSARVLMDPADFQGSVPVPGINRYWSEVPESYAIVPGFDARVAPISLFNRSDKAALLQGNPGLVGGVAGLGKVLRTGDSVVLDGGSGAPSGAFTLLPRAYALLPGAYLITPQSTSALSGRAFRSRVTPEGAILTTGYARNNLHEPSARSPLRSMYELVPQEVLGRRVKYEVFDLSRFIADAATRNELDSVQERPADAGYLGIHGNTGLRLDGAVLASGGVGGRGGRVDLSSFAPITIGSGAGAVVLDPAKISAYGAESILIGGLRSFSADAVRADVRAPSITIANAGSSFRAPEIFLLATNRIDFAPGAVLVATGTAPKNPMRLLVAGDGVGVMAGTNSGSSISRSSTTGSSSPVLNIGAWASISGSGLVLDSSATFSIDPTASISGGRMKIGAGQIRIVTGGAAAFTGQINPAVTPLVLSGGLLNNISSGAALTLASYLGGIDLYGPGSWNVGNTALGFETAALRAFGQGAGAIDITAGSVSFSNPAGIAAPAAPAGSGILRVTAGEIIVGQGSLELHGIADTDLTASGGVLFTGEGGLSTPGGIRLQTPALVVAQGASQRLLATGDLLIDRIAGSATAEGGLGGSLLLGGNTMRVMADIMVPSGKIEMRSNGNLVVGGAIRAGGTATRIYDLQRFTDGGEIVLTSLTGNVDLLASSDLSVAGSAGGGNAGRVSVSAFGGSFSGAGIFDGSAAAGWDSGSFSLDTWNLASTATLRDKLNSGGFYQERDIRLRNGDLTLDGTIATGDAWKARTLRFSADDGGIFVLGDLDARGVTGGTISLSARKDIELRAGSLLTVAAAQFSNAGKGGSVFLEAGATKAGSENTAGRVRMLAGSQIDLSVARFRQGATPDPNGSILDPTSSAFLGQFQGTLHLRAPQISGFTDVGIDSLLADIRGASSVLIEGFRTYSPPGGVMNTTLRNQIHSDALLFLGAAGIGNANESAISTRLLTASPSAVAVAPVMVLAPGVEIVNTAGDLVLGQANPTGSTTAQAQAQAHTAADWDFSGFRYGSKSAPGVLTLRATGDLVFNNTLSDGFTPVPVNATNGFSRMWLAPLMTINPNLPVNTQSWSYRLTAGADLGAADVRATLRPDLLVAGKGSVLVGEFYPDLLNSFTSGSAAGSGSLGTTANQIRFANSASDAVNRGTRYEVVRTGTGDILVNAGRDIQLRNQFSTIYTAGVALPDRTRIFAADDFVVPIISRSGLGITPTTPDGNLGVPQQRYDVHYSMAGGDLSLRAGSDIGRFTFRGGAVVADLSRQLPTNWLYRRGYVDDSGAFGLGGVTLGNVNDAAASTTWWVDYSNFFQGFGVLGGGDIEMLAGRDLVNADAALPTNARMKGRVKNPDGTFTNITPDSANLHQLGGGDLVARAGRNIDGGSYYVERGEGTLFAGISITTNIARSATKIGTAADNELTWLPTVLYLGDSHFDVAARGNVLLGPMTNPFLLPQGMNNRFWYKTQFNTFQPQTGVDVLSYSGSVTHRLDVTLGADELAVPILSYWTQSQNLRSPGSSANEQPWLRLAESSVGNFQTMFTVGVPNLRSSALGGDVNIVGDMVLFPSSTGMLEIAAAGGIPGLQRSGANTDRVAWTSATIAQSDADPSRPPGVTSPLAFQSIVKSRVQADLLDDFNLVNPLESVNPIFKETGAVSGSDAAVSKQTALHASGILHAANPNPVRIYAAGGDISGLTLFAANAARVHAERDINDVAFYLQNPTPESITIVSAGRDIILFNENSPLRSVASDLARGNLIVDLPYQLTTAATTKALPGDLQIGGRGVLEVLAGRNLDLGTGANFVNGGLGRGITSIGRARNPFLPNTGADIIAVAGIRSTSGGPASGLRDSTWDFDGFIAEYLGESGAKAGTFPGLAGLDKGFASLSSELQAVYALGAFFEILKKSAATAAETGSYDSGYAAASTLFGKGAAGGGSKSIYGWGPWSSEKEVTSLGQVFTRVRDVRTGSQGSISILTPSGGISMAPSIFGNPLTPPGIVTELGGGVSIFMESSLDIGQARVFTLRGGDVTIWSSSGDIAAGAAPKTVVTAPPTRVTVDRTSALVVTDLGGLATGGGIGVLAAVEGVEAGAVNLIAPKGTVDAGDAGIRATGDITIAAAAVVNADNIAAGGQSVGAAAPAPAAVSAPVAPATTTPAAATTSAAESMASGQTQASEEPEPAPSVFAVEVLGYGGSDEEEDEEEGAGN